MFMKFIAALAGMIASMGLATAQVDVNRADSAMLDSVKGIGPATAKRILDERSKGGHFKDWPDFDARVKGIGEKSATKLSQAGLTVNGRAISGAIAASSVAVVALPIATVRNSPARTVAAPLAAQAGTGAVSPATSTGSARVVVVAAQTAPVARQPVARNAAVRNADARDANAKLDDRPPVIDLRPVAR